MLEKRRDGENVDAVSAMDEQSLEPIFERARRWSPSTRQAMRMLREVDDDSRRHGRMWMRKTVTGLASAAAIGAAVLLLFWPTYPRAWALADVSRIMGDAPIIKRISSDGITWNCRSRYCAVVSADGSRIWFQDYASDEIAHYDGNRGEHGVIFLNTTDPSDTWVIPNREIENDLQKFIEEAARKGHAFEELWDREEIVESGKPMIKITLKERKRTPVYEHVIDGRTGMIDRSTSWTDTIRYEYPDAGPRDIYDLGVPRDTEVIDSRATPELLDLRDRVVTAMDIDYGPHVMMKIQSGRSTYLERFVSDGERYRTDKFPAHDFDLSSPQKMALVAEQLIESDLGSLTRANRLFDGREVTHVSRSKDGIATGRYTYDRRLAMSFAYSLRESTWWSEKGVFFSRGQWSAQWEFLGPDMAGREGFRILSQANELDRPRLHEVWYDPSHGLLPDQMRWITFPDPDWQLNPDWHEEYIKGVKSSLVRLLPEAPAQGTMREVVEWGELVPGVWYPMLSITRFIVRNDEGDWVDQCNSGFENGQVTLGTVLRREQVDQPTTPEPRPASTYTYVLALPLEHLEDKWFEVPDEWLDVPIKNP